MHADPDDLGRGNIMKFCFSVFSTFPSYIMLAQYKELKLVFYLGLSCLDLKVTNEIIRM